MPRPVNVLRIPRLHAPRVAVIGAGIGGLSAAVDLAHAGAEVTVFERAASPGGKMRQVVVGDRHLDAGPSVFTLRGVFDELFANAGDRLDRRVTLERADLLARHAWSERESLDLFADLGRSADAIGAFAGRESAAGFLRFAAQAGRIYRTLDDSFMRASRPTPFGLLRRVGVRRLTELWNIDPFRTLWRSLGRYFPDPRLRQLFGRYATYCGSSPFAAPATLMLVAHVEQSGVWYVRGGMHELARQCAALAERQGARLHYGRHVERILLRHGRVSAVATSDGEITPVDAVICNAECSALAAGLFGTDSSHAVRATSPEKRSLSAFTLNLLARTEGFELAHHTVFFGTDYAAEFDAIFARRCVPSAPTVYVCAPDRRDGRPPLERGAEPLFCLINAPAVGDTRRFDEEEVRACESRIFQALGRCGLAVHRQHDAPVATTPADFHHLFPGSGGALYGAASHGWMSSFRRPGSRTAIAGLYLAGGGVHPGPGIPMAAISGRLAAASVMSDCASTARCHEMAMPGGTSMD